MSITMHFFMARPGIAELEPQPKPPPLFMMPPSSWSQDGTSGNAILHTVTIWREKGLGIHSTPI